MVMGDPGALYSATRNQILLVKSSAFRPDQMWKVHLPERMYYEQDLTNPL